MTNGYPPYSPGQGSTGASQAPRGAVRGFGMGNASAPQVPYAQGQQAGWYAQGSNAPTYGQVPFGSTTGGGYANTGASYAGMSAPQAPKRKRGAAFWVSIIVVLICLGLAAALAYTTLVPQPKTSRMGVPGQLEGKTPEEVQAELNRVVEEGMFNISIASAVLFADGTSPGELRIENVPGNLYLMRVVIRLDATGEQVYETDMIEPNNHIQQDTLDVDLDPGTYDATAVFTAYDPETEAEMGQAAAKITLLVQG